ncbi:extracellular solute-binding protein [Paenibacillus eucommiae]|uniref:Aldouronate transport system substrate-binding protein n=1 Tax=Paenibacillus eucommiae TaxID=1355755 RepID=A0ABS4IWJ6_9BACL|nr:extracellular solute-binding protein [Paenibacillus eucommiae]MBP1991971.1 putative aldouronate transport system substrate-binding protein [Paenibacillus eucommiae]
MKRKRKTMLIVMVSLLLLVAACSKSNNSGDNSKVEGNDVKQKGTASPDAEKYPKSMTYWVSKASSTLTNNSEVAMYKEMEKITGTKVEFQHPPEGHDADQFNLMMVSGKLPDVIFHTWSSSFPDKSISEGKILRLNELIEEHAPNLAKLFKERPYIKRDVMSADGNIFVFPLLGDDPRLTVFNGPMLRGDWLEKLNLQVPTTLDEWEKVLIAFRDGDPNGNQLKDEIPFHYNVGNMEYSFAFIGAFGITYSFFQDNGKVKFGPYEPQYKDFLTLMNKWYKDGLIDKDYMTVDAKLQDAKVTGNQLGSFTGWLGGNLGKYMNLMKDQDPKFKLVGAPFPTIEKDGKAVANHDPIFYGQGAAITTSAKDPEKIAAWLDYAYGEEGHLLYNFGIEGESYTMVDGKPTFTDLIMKNPKGLTVGEALSEYSVMGSFGPFEFDADGYSQYNTLVEQKEAQAQWTKADFSKLMPTIYMTAEEQARYSVIMTDLETYRVEMTNKFIIGAESLDKFDEYIATLKRMNIEEAIQIQQAAYDRSQAN